MRKKLLLPIVLLAGCTNAYQLQQQQFANDNLACDTKYGLTSEITRKLGEYEIPNGWEDWIACHEAANLKVATGTWNYPFVLEQEAKRREIVAKFKAKEINRSQMNALMLQATAEVTQKAQQFRLQAQAAQAPYIQAQQAQSKRMVETGLKMMQGPTPAQPTHTNCLVNPMGWQCQTQ